MMDAQVLPATTPRPRPTKSCLVCRRRKVKCDRTHPTCAKCKAQGLRCEYAAAGNNIRFVEVPGAEEASGSVGGNQNDVNMIASQGEAPPPSNHPVEGESLEKSLRSGVFGHGRYIGGVFWGLANDTNPSDVQRILRAASSTTETSFLLSDVFPSLPPQDEADRFFNLYLTSVHPIFPLLNIPIITASYTTLWTRDNIELSELLLLVSILYSGHICTPGSYHDSLAALYNLLLSRSSFETSPTLPLLQAYVIYNSSDVSEALPLTSFTFLPSAVRSAQAMGLHTEPPNPLLPQQQEMRRRLWWHLVYLDVEASIASGLPRLIHPEDYDTPHPSSSDLSPSMGLALSARWEWTERMQRWLRRPPGSSETEAFSSRCEQLAGAATEPWARDYILLQPPRACCVLSHRIKSLRSSPLESALYASARSFLHLYLTLASSPTYHWFLPGLLHPLHATIILLLREELPSVEERGLLDRVFLSVGNTIVNGVLIPRAQGPKKDGTMWIYCLLGKLKGGVWRRAGWEMQGNERFCKLPSAEVEEEEREFDWEEWDRMVGIFFTAS